MCVCMCVGGGGGGGDVVVLLGRLFFFNSIRRAIRCVSYDPQM